MNPINPIQRFIGGIPGIGLAQVVPNTVEFVVSSWLRAHRVPMYPSVPAAPFSVGLTAQVALDEVVLGVMRSAGRHPHHADYARVGEELRQARDLYESRGWIDDPRRYHRKPGPLVPIERSRSSSRGVTYERVAWESGFTPHPGEPGAERWLAHEANRTAYAFLVRAREPTANWVVCIHGFGMGSVLTDFHAFRARHLATELGCNLALPVLPLHGPRNASRLSGTDFMTFDLMHPVFGVSQAVWDIRSLVAWLRRSEGAAHLGMHGISLGGYTCALVAGLDDSFDLAIAGIPAVDFPSLFRHHSPVLLRRQALEYGMLGEVPAQVHRVVSPLAVDPLVPRDRRFIYAALGDRMSTPAHAHKLWNHWGRPRIQWLEAGHVGSVLNPAVDAFVSEILVRTGFTSQPPVMVAV